MFTGIIEQQGYILKKNFNQAGLLHQIEISYPGADLQIGESIAVNGACLTAIDCLKGKGFRADLSAETVQLTNFVHLDIDTGVNIERSLKLSDRLSGHWVTGHIDQSARIASLDTIDACRVFTLSGIPSDQQCLLVPKGSIAINGVSLTINKVWEDKLTLMVIPKTLEITNLSQLQVGDRVNVEFDMLAKMVRNMTLHTASPAIV